MEQVRSGIINHFNIPGRTVCTILYSNWFIECYTFGAKGNNFNATNIAFYMLHQLICQENLRSHKSY